MKLVAIKDLFTIKYGNSLELIRLDKCKKTDWNAINFVSRTENNNGVSAIVEKVISESLNPAHTLSVAVGGSVLATFYQSEEYYTGFHVLVLIPKKAFSVLEMLFYAMCIRKNKYRYSYGRQANKTLKDLLIPETMPDKFQSIDFDGICAKANEIKTVFKIENSQDIKPIAHDAKLVPIKDLFTIKYGNSLELVRLDKCKKTDWNAVNFVSRTEKNNGISAIVEKIISEVPNPAHTLSVAGGGSVLATFYQSKEYYSGRDIYCLIPKKEFSTLEMLFYATCIRKNKYRYSYGRQANKTLKDLLIPEKMPEEFNVIDIEKLTKLVV
ncbi:MAG: restriction endonuclease subunit S [Methylococcaceae bacterium]